MCGGRRSAPRPPMVWVYKTNGKCRSSPGSPKAAPEHYQNSPKGDLEHPQSALEQLIKENQSKCTRNHRYHYHRGGEGKPIKINENH